MSDLREKRAIDKFSFQLGMINCFAEMVACGVKKLAISPPLLPNQYETIAPYSEKIVKAFAIESYLENSLLITLLQSPEFTQGKCSILYYKSRSIIETYLELKARQASLVDSNHYDARAQEEISIDFMELLSYPPEVIKAKLSGSHPDPFLIIEP